MNKLFYSSALLVLALVLSSCGSPATAIEVEVTATEEHVMTMEVPTEAATEAPTESPTDAPEESGPAPLEGEVSIDIAGFKFSESSVTIRVGTTVTWTNNDDGEHTVTSDDVAFNSSLTDGGTFSFTFTETGEFPYHCEIHRSMKAKIIVVE
jgi:plastocyanin